MISEQMGNMVDPGQSSRSVQFMIRHYDSLQIHSCANPLPHPKMFETESKNLD